MKQEMLPPKVDPKLAAVALFTKPQMAAMLQISIRTLNDMMQRGKNVIGKKRKIILKSSPKRFNLIRMRFKKR